MANFIELQNLVSTTIIDLPTAVQALVPTLVRRAVHELQNVHDFKVMEERSQWLTAIGSRNLVANWTPVRTFKKFRNNPWYTTDLGERTELLVAPNEEAVLDAIGEQDEGAPAVILDGNMDKDGVRVFEIYPLPDGNSDFADGEYRVSIPQWGYLPALSAGTDTNWFTVNAEEYIHFMAASYGFSIDWDEERAVYWRQLAETKKREIVNLDKMYRLSSVRELVPHLDARDAMLRH